MQTTKIISAALLLCFLYSCKGRQNNVAGASKASVFQLLVAQRSQADAAWGYIITVNQRPYIKQFTIPALEGNQLFASKAQAYAAGNLVMFKLNHAQHPTITKKELDSLGIIQLSHVIQKK